MVPLGAFEDLQAKLHAMELERSEDREKLKENERVKAELESAHISLTRLSETVKHLQKEATESRRELEESAEIRQTTEKQISELSETLEMLTLDKEVAEERVEVLQAEIETLNGKVEELNLELEVMKEEGKASETHL